MPNCGSRERKKGILKVMMQREFLKIDVNSELEAMFGFSNKFIEFENLI